MGIKNLNKIVRNYCKNSTKIISLKDLSGKKIVIDISIYLYRFAKDNTLIENIFLMISIFHYYHITPIFVFDGKPPIEKRDLLIQRIKDKKLAENQYNSLKEKLDIVNDFQEKKEISLQLHFLKKQFVSISKDQINKVKNLIISCGASYLEAVGEADELCAILVLKNEVWACLSEDTDMFVYGCPRVLRYFSLLNHTCVFYDMEKILLDLQLNQEQFRRLCILSGTDYNSSNELSLESLLISFKNYLHKDVNFCFENWMSTILPNNNLLNRVNTIFDLSEKSIDDMIKTDIDINFIKNYEKSNDKLREILKEDGFLFISSILVK
jgi:hypothetical protein